MHAVAVGTYGMDLGAFTPIVYAFADRERIMDILQCVTGSRLTYCYYRFGGVSADVNDEFIRMTKEFTSDFRKRLPMYRGLVTDNVILRVRCEEIGVIPVEMARRYGATGPVLRGSGVVYDVRKVEPYSVYDRLTFEAECSPIRWFYHTARTQANFYESCQLRDALAAFAAKPERSPELVEQHRAMFNRWRQVLLDEQANTQAALPLVERDMRLDCYYGTDHAFPHAADMIRAKLQLLEKEIGQTLPAIGRRCGFN